jgi:hypothetical protein
MTRRLIPFFAAAAGLLTLAACETTSPQSEDITWNAPRSGEATTTNSPPLTTPQTAAPAPQAKAPTEPECREYQTTVTIDGKPEKAYGKACRQPDGTWKQMGTSGPTPSATGPQGEQSYPYGWYGYDYPEGPRLAPGTSLGVGVGTGSGGSGGFVGYGVGF